MFVPALLLMLLNTSYLMPPARLQIPALQTVGQALLPAAPPPCVLSPTEGSWNGESLLCRSPAPNTPVNQSWSLLRATYSAADDTWSTQSLGRGPDTPAIVSWVSDPASNVWVLTAGAGNPASGGGTAGNGGGPPVLTYLPADAALGPPVTIYRGPLTIFSIQASDQGVYALVQNRSIGIGITLFQVGIVAWSWSNLPRRPVADFPWMLGTVTPRYLTTFTPPTAAQPQTLYTVSATYPPTLEMWSKNTTTNLWSVDTTLPLRSVGSQAVTQIYSGQPPGLRILTRKTVSQITWGATGPTETLLSSLPPISPLSYQAVTGTQVWGSATATARPSQTVSPSASTTRSAVTTITAVPTLPPGESPWTTPSAVPTSSALPTETASATTSTSATGTATASSSSTASTSATSAPTLTPYAASSSGLRSYTATATASATPLSSLTPSPTSTNGTIPAEPPAAAATTLTPQQELGLGFGLTAGLLVLGGGIAALFFRQAVFALAHWFKQKIQGLRAKPRRPPPRRANSVASRNPIDPSVIQLNINPAMLQQQTAMDMLQLARQQRLEAMQVQLAQSTTSDTHIAPKALRSFKMTYAPQRAPGFPGSSV